MIDPAGTAIGKIIGSAVGGVVGNGVSIAMNVDLDGTEKLEKSYDLWEKTETFGVEQRVRLYCMFISGGQSESRINVFFQ